MKFKGLLMIGAALVAIGATNSAQASERLSLHEVNNFVTKMTNAVNSPDPRVVRGFLNRNIASGATYSNTLNETWVEGDGYQQAWTGYNISPSYRYPHGYNTYLKPTSYEAVGKAGLIGQIEHKKTIIPRYHQTMSVLGSKMPTNASSAIVDVNLREYGLSYAAAPYGAYHGKKIEHANARCQLHLGKKDGQVMLTRMDCNTMSTSSNL